MTKKDFPRDVRHFVSFHRVAVLSSISKSYQQYPFGSLVPYDINSQGEPIIFISNIAEHYRNISEDPRASLIIFDRFGLQDPQSHARATILGKFKAVKVEHLAQVEDSFWKRFPSAQEREIAHNFVFFSLSIERIRWIGNFGDIAWVDIDEYFENQTDPIAYEGIPIVEHMNADHRSALCEYLSGYADINALPSQVAMVDISATGFVIALQHQGCEQRISIPFRESISQVGKVRELMIDLLKECRERSKL